MRKAFAETLLRLARRDERIVLMTADLGFMVLEPFAESLPDRFFNVGVAEANMIGLATGLAADGFIPFLYSIATFATLRGYEQWRNGPVLHNLPVRLVGIGGGFAYGAGGASHHGLEDIALARLQSEVAVVVPADAAQTAVALETTCFWPRPIYYRIGKDDETLVAGLNGRFRSGRVESLREGGDVLILTLGAIASETVAAAEQLTGHGIEATVGLVSTLQPAPADDVRQLLAKFQLVVTVEEHYLTGGLGSWTAEVMAQAGAGNRLVRIGVPALSSGVSGSERFLRRRYALDAENIAGRIAGELAK